MAGRPRAGRPKGEKDVALRKLVGEQVDQVLARAAGQKLPLTVTTRHGNRWVSLRSLLLSANGNGIWIKPPAEPGASLPYGLKEGEQVGVAFRIEPHKYTMATTIGPLGDCEGAEARSLKAPEKLSVTDRRVHPRVEVPHGRAAFWPGGREAEPDHMTPDRPIWTGTLVDISANGAQVRSGSDAAQYLETGDLVGLKLTFGDDEGVCIDAQFRHAVSGTDTANLGFQFVGLERSLENMEALERIVAVIEEIGTGG